MLWVAARADSPFTTVSLWSFLATIAAFTVVFVALAVRAPNERASHLLVAVQSVLGLVANWLIPMALPGVALTGILLAVAAGAFARWSRRAALACITAQTLLLLAIYALAHGWAVGIAVLAASGYGLMQVVLESNWRHVLLERARSIELEAAMRDLRSTQAMLAETALADQRSEIAGDLHDVVGHQLVALGLQL
ncbi:MAG: histidine kinase, partial [Planctomycetia bacterium]